MNPKLVVGNWKMNGRLADNRARVGALRGSVPEGVEVAVCAPFPYLAQLADLVAGSRLEYGAQDVSEFADGACTGQVSAGMLGDFGCRYVIVGHSERRSLAGEDDATVARKAAAALDAGIVPIACIGETAEERDADRVEAVLRRQLDALDCASLASRLDSIVLAYEPVWAIGTGRVATPAQVSQVLALVRAWLAERVARPERVRILYGGSVRAENAAALFDLQDADGALVGGASLDAEEFAAICRAAAPASP
ncbi:triose-phosphate isomerase [Pseudazoarcus pumilus]|uniref:Triosephosphate isomerase n=1 Tax=Pseudazoarcus pumilus TaxID=2067960 RepID=A0A2I6S688_9RHOO|nr:triose-phosphate isomerase [Pseudazoarcus pumilus]AUN94774.1 triose-phosphate isomerase [Pseudazoarcus pumilus]